MKKALQTIKALRAAADALEQLPVALMQPEPPHDRMFAPITPRELRRYADHIEALVDAMAEE